MQHRSFLAFGGAAVVSLAALFGACGDGPDPVPTPTLIPSTPTKPATATPASTSQELDNAGTPGATTTGETQVANNGAVIGLKASDLTELATTPSGLKYHDDVIGTGATPTMASTVTVNYVGTNAATGEQFDASSLHGGPASFPMNGVIKGFSEGLSTMKVGGKRTILIPAALGYGPAIAGNPVTGDIIFQIELLAVK